MKTKYLHILVASLLSFYSFGQVTDIWQESFETDGEGTRYTSTNTFRDGTQDYFFRTDGVTTGTTINIVAGSYVSPDGSFFFAGEDLDDNGGDGLPTKGITFDPIDISGRTSLLFKGLFASGNDGYENADYIRVFYTIDGGTEQNGLWFSQEATGTNNQPIGLDADFDTDADNTTGVGRLTATFQEFTFSIPSGGSSLVLRIEISANSGSEELAFDNFRVEGSVTTTTWDGAAWSNGVPSASKSGIINGAYDTGTDGVFTAYDLDVTALGSVNIAASNTLQVVNDIDNLGTFTIQSDGSLYMTNDAASVSGAYNVLRDSPNNANQFFFNYWSSPVQSSDTDLNTLFPSSVGNIFNYNASTMPADWNFTSGQMGLATGYAVRANQTGVHTASYSGLINNGSISTPVFYNVDANEPTDVGFNLLGNPYPSAMDWETFAADNSGAIDGTVYFWRQTIVTTGDNLAIDYIAYNSTGSNPPGATGNIGTGQGFIVQALNGGTGSVTFDNSHRIVDNNTQFFRNQANNNDGRIWLRMAGNSYFATILIGFIPEGTDGFDNGFDGAFIGEGSTIELYSWLNTQKLAIQALPVLTNQDKQVALGGEVTGAADYTLSIDQEFINTDFDIILEDTDQSTMTDLRAGNYTFNLASAQEFNSRFIVHFNYNQVLGIDDVGDGAIELKALIEDNVLHTVTNKEGASEITLYDLSGKMVHKAPFAQQTPVPLTAKGLYIVKIAFEDGTSVVRKLIN